MEAVFQIFAPEEPQLERIFNTLCAGLRTRHLISRRYLPGPEDVRVYFREALDLLGLEGDLEGLCDAFWHNGSARDLAAQMTDTGPGLPSAIRREALHAYYTHLASVITAVNLCLTHDRRRAEADLSPEDRRLSRRDRAAATIAYLAGEAPLLVDLAHVRAVLDAYPLAISLPVWEECTLTPEAQRLVDAYLAFTTRFQWGTRSMGERFERWVADRLRARLPSGYLLEIPTLSPGTASLPDALVTLPDGRRIVIEVKSGATAAVTQLEKHSQQGEVVLLLSRYGSAVPEISGPPGCQMPPRVHYQGCLFTIQWREMIAGNY